MNLWRSLEGFYALEVTSADPENFLNRLNEENIPVFQICPKNELAVSLKVSRSNYKKLKVLAEKKGDSISVTGRMGHFWSIRSMLARPVLICGLLFLLLLQLFLPGRILFVRVEGNQRIPSQRILSAAEESGLRFGASRRQIRSEQVKNALLGQLPELEWAGVNTRGCLAVLSVREKTLSEENNRATTVCSIVAARDGVVDFCNATSGNLLCKPGDAVSKGQTLISAYTDCGLYLRAGRAAGEIYALTVRDFQGICPLQGRSRTLKTGIKRRYSLIVGKKRINLWKDSGIWDATCDRMYAEYYITLPGDFRLPFGVAVDVHSYWETERAEFPNDSLEEFARSTLNGQMIAGQILSSKEQLRTEKGLRILTGTYVCREMIGREKQEQMGESYVENN